MFKSPKYKSDDMSIIDCIYDHAEFGEIEITLNKFDEVTKDLYYDLLNSNIEISPFQESIEEIPFNPDLVKIECGRRIKTIASDNFQKNTSAAFIIRNNEIMNAIIQNIPIPSEAEIIANGGMRSEDVPVYIAGKKWIDAMRAKYAELASLKVSDFTADYHWPTPSNDIIELVNSGRY